MTKKNNTQNKNFDFKKIAVVTALLVLTVFVVVGGTLIFSQLGENSIENTNELHTKFLEDTIIELKRTIEAKESFNDNLTLGSNL